MGCTSSKKRTTSVDDLTAADKKEPGSSSKKNSQLSNDAKRKGAGDAIQIPGTHNSFMAPDGIPFIDEDVDEDMETRGRTVVANATTAKADVNRNVVQAEVKTSALSVPVAQQSTSAEEISKVEDDKKREIGAEIMKQEIEMTQNASHVPTTTSETVHVEHVVITTTTESHPVVNGLEPANEEEQERAAVKIQAGIRGYRDRQRVKALRAHQQHLHEEETPTAVANGEHAVDGVIADVPDHDNMQVTSERNDLVSVEKNEEMDRAAVKIQASYKGYKTRKQLGKF